MVLVFFFESFISEGFAANAILHQHAVVTTSGPPLARPFWRRRRPATSIPIVGLWDQSPTIDVVGRLTRSHRSSCESWASSRMKMDASMHRTGNHFIAENSSTLPRPDAAIPPTRRRYATRTSSPAIPPLWRRRGRGDATSAPAGAETANAGPPRQQTPVVRGAWKIGLVSRFEEFGVRRQPDLRPGCGGGPDRVLVARTGNVERGRSAAGLGRGRFYCSSAASWDDEFGGCWHWRFGGLVGSKLERGSRG